MLSFHGPVNPILTHDFKVPLGVYRPGFIALLSSKHVVHVSDEEDVVLGVEPCRSRVCTRKVETGGDVIYQVQSQSVGRSSLERWVSGQRTALFNASQKYTSKDSVKGLVKKGRALGNGIRKVCTGAEEIVRVLVAGRPLPAVEAVGAKDDARDLWVRLAVSERFNSRGDAEVVFIAVIPAVLSEVVAVQVREVPRPPWFIIRVFVQSPLVFRYILDGNRVAIAVQDGFALVIGCGVSWLMQSQKGAVAKQPESGSWIYTLAVIPLLIVEKVSDILDIVWPPRQLAGAPLELGATMMQR